MYKLMNNPYIRQPLFAADGAGTGGSDGDGGQGDPAGGDDQDGEDPDEGGNPEEKRYSQAEMDAAVEKRLAREKRKWQREKQKEEKPDSKEKTGENSEKEVPDSSELDKERKKTEKLTMRLACYDAGVPKEAVKDVTALAKAYMEEDEDLDFEDAIEKVLKKYPQFKGTEDTGEKGAWGQRQKGKGAKEEKSLEDEIEAALYGK